jgi:hypothetical protein
MIAATAPAYRPLDELLRGSGLRSLVMGSSKDPNAKITLLLVPPDGHDPVLAIKVPTTRVAAVAVEDEARVLDALAGLGGELGATLPRVVDRVEFDGRVGLVTTAVHGIPMTTSYHRWRHTASRGRVAADFAAVERWLAAFQARTSGPATRLGTNVDVPGRLAERFAGDAGIDVDVERVAGLHAALADTAVPETAVHGDLWCGNVMLRRGRVSGVVDWEAGAPAGDGVRDLVRFAHMYALFLDRRTRPGRRVTGHGGLRATDWGAGVEHALRGSGWFPELFRRFVQTGLARLGAPPRLWRTAALAGIAEVAALTDDPAFARSHLELLRRIWPGGRLSCPD